ncbi:MAG: ATP-binding protein [Prevotellaceae bacterium]|jgi:AAA+ ATPase superfamily predicted ATPase|nr:ATP-binding protein [Prevotellaceae bacterium]
MRFFDREKEIERLNEIAEMSKETAQFTVITGRRRIGKTQLLLRATEGQPTLYFFVTRKAESFLCQDFQQEISVKLNIPILGSITSFGRLFQFLMQTSAERHFNLIIDEFQEFFNINPAIYGEMQQHWDLNKDKSKMNLLVCGSVFSLLHKIFKDYKAPLFGRATEFILLRPFKVSVLKEILKENLPSFNSEDLLALYSFTGGVAKYVQLLVDNKALKFSKMIDFIVREDSQFIFDGKNMLIDEFGKDYGIYFTILSAIAHGENTRGAIENYTGKEVGGYLTRLEQDYGLISKIIPIFAKTESKNVRYAINDNFLTFWFRFIFKYSHIIEIAQYNELKRIIERDYATFSGKMLERYFRDLFIEHGGFTQIGSYWDRTGENEIDLVALNELDMTAQIVEIKRNEKHIRFNALKEKAKNMINKTARLAHYKIEYKGLDMSNM